jgi:dCMP deaminase
MAISWDEYIIELCEVTKKKSKDITTQIGVVIIGKDKQIITTGYNSFPRGVDDTVKERQERPLKHHWFSHAETNAIINSALNGTSTKDSIMYMSCGIPCTGCARNIINAGIKEIVCRKDYSIMNNPIKSEEIGEISIEMFNEAGVKVRYWN